VLISFLLVHKVIFADGIIAGSDWGSGVTNSQIRQQFIDSFQSWTRQYFMTGVPKNFNNGWPLFSLIYLFSILGLSPWLIQRIILISILSFSGWSVFFLLRYLKASKIASLIGGVFLITSPIFFNYIIMGWLYVLLSSGLLALFIYFSLRAVNEKKYYLSIVAALIMTAAMVQSQSIIWFGIYIISQIFLYVSDKKSTIRYIKSTALILFVFVSASSYIWIPIFFNSAKSLSTNLGLSVTSLGTWENLTYVNILRLWGSLYNYQFEINYLPSLIIFSFVPTLVVLGGLFFKNNKKMTTYFFTPTLVLPLLFFLGVKVIVKMPFSDLYRDIARFTILNTFSYSIIIALTIDNVLKLENKYISRTLSSVVAFSLLVNINPFIFGKQYFNRPDRFVSLRTYNYSDDYYEFERYLSEINPKGKSLYLPSRNNLSYTDNHLFNGDYHEAWDVFAGYSISPGDNAINDRFLTSKMTSSETIVNSIMTNNLSILNHLAIERIVLRKNVDYPQNFSLRVFLDGLASNKSFDVEFNSRDIISYKYNENSPLISVKTNSKEIAIPYSKISETRYDLELPRLNEQYDLIFKDSFNTGWVLYCNSSKSSAINKAVRPFHYQDKLEYSHQIYNGFGNEWKLDSKSTCPDEKDNIRMTLYYYPQYLLNIGMGISIFVIISSLVIIIKGNRKSDSKKE